MIVREMIAQGGFGRVELVEKTDGTFVARKTFDPSLYVESNEVLEKMRQRFIREVKIQSSMSSSSFVPILEYDLSGPNPWFTMPVAEKNFAKEIGDARQSGNTLENALADILNALEELHELEFVHRDLKPENILKIDEHWCLTDFGLILPPTGTTIKITSYASNWGTAAYCAPEQAVDFRNATAAVDIYSFGCILHDIFGTKARIPYQQHNAEGPIGLIIQKCTEQNPNRRFRSVRSLRSALINCLSAIPDLSISTSSEEWKSALGSVGEWDQDKLEEFARYIKSLKQTDDIFILFYDLSEDHIETLRHIDAELWKIVALRYCQWVEESMFAWNYCDVLVRRLETIFMGVDMELAAACALAAAELGRSHNRWFVMRRVLVMCGPELQDVLAQRIQIEIRAAEVEENFRKCADIINMNYNNYHPLIAKILDDD